MMYMCRRRQLMPECSLGSNTMHTVTFTIRIRLPHRFPRVMSLDKTFRLAFNPPSRRSCLLSEIRQLPTPAFAEAGHTSIASRSAIRALQRGQLGKFPASAEARIVSPHQLLTQLLIRAS